MFSISTRNLHALQSFNDCDAWYKSAKPVTKSPWQDNERPLENARMHHKRLVLNSDGSYSCTLYRCPHVTYHKDGTVEVRLYDSVSSRAFLGRMLPRGIDVVTERGLMLLRVATDNIVEWLQSDGHPFLLEPHHGARWKVLAGHQQRCREFVHRQKSKEVRQKIKPYLKWWQAANNVVPTQVYAGKPPGDLIEQIESPEVWPRLAQQTLNPAWFTDHAYDVLGARVVLDIPNTTPPRRGRTAAFS
jgi:hypothetical protein